MGQMSVSKYIQVAIAALLFCSTAWAGGWHEGEHQLHEIASRQDGALGQVAVAAHAWPTGLSSRREGRPDRMVSGSRQHTKSNSVQGRKTLMAGSPVHHHPEDPTHTFHPSHAKINGYLAQVGKPWNSQISD